MRRERPTFMIKLWDTLKNKTQQMLLEQENEELKDRVERLEALIERML